MHEYLRLGASLYVPASRPDLLQISIGHKLGALRTFDGTRVGVRGRLGCRRSHFGLRVSTSDENTRRHP